MLQTSNIYFNKKDKDGNNKELKKKKRKQPAGRRARPGVGRQERLEETPEQRLHQGS